jgi:hypothetical protein
MPLVTAVERRDEESRQYFDNIPSEISARNLDPEQKRFCASTPRLARSNPGEPTAQRRRRRTSRSPSTTPKAPTVCGSCATARCGTQHCRGHARKERGEGTSAPVGEPGRDSHRPPAARVEREGTEPIARARPTLGEIDPRVFARADPPLIPPTHSRSPPAHPWPRTPHRNLFTSAGRCRSPSETCEGRP